uniref:Uncharacterized protein n=1 Tax=Arundo donax TaxID=35708 RepID=A0A0A9DEU9_ARUDO
MLNIRRPRLMLQQLKLITRRNQLRMAPSTLTSNSTRCPQTLIWMKQDTRAMSMMMNASWTLTVLTRAIRLRHQSMSKSFTDSTEKMRQKVV